MSIPVAARMKKYRARRALIRALERAYRDGVDVLACVTAVTPIGVTAAGMVALRAGAPLKSG
jgi:hypothetical protein